MRTYKTKCQIVTASSLDWLRKQPALSIDVAIFSPPYGKGPKFLFNVANPRWLEHFGVWAAELSRVCRVWGVNFTPLVDEKTKGCLPFQEAMVMYLGERGSLLFDRWVMYKSTPRPARGNKALSSFEFVLLFSADPKAVPFNGARILTAFPEESARGVDFSHSNQLGQRAYSQAIPRQMILAHCPPGGSVLDPFCGSGTTGVVAKELGVARFVGVEIDPEVAQLARRTLGLEVA